MKREKRLVTDILSLLLLSISVISFIPRIISFDMISENTNLIIFPSLLLLASFSLFFIFKNLNIRNKKAMSIILIAFYYLCSISTLFIFRNGETDYKDIYIEIKTFLPYLFILVQFYSLDSIFDDDKKFVLMLYLSSIFFIISFFSLDIDGIILVAGADIIYSLVEIRKHFFKTLLYVLACFITLFVCLLLISSWTNYFFESYNSIVFSRNADEFINYVSIMPANYEYNGDNYLVMLTNSFGLLGLIITTVVFAMISYFDIKDGICIPFWFFSVFSYVLSFVSILTMMLNFEFYIISPSILTIALNSICFGVISNRSKEIK